MKTQNLSALKKHLILCIEVLSMFIEHLKYEICYRNNLKLIFSSLSSFVYYIQFHLLNELEDFFSAQHSIICKLNLHDSASSCLQFSNN